MKPGPLCLCTFVLPSLPALHVRSPRLLAGTGQPDMALELLVGKSAATVLVTCSVSNQQDWLSTCCVLGTEDMAASRRQRSPSPMEPSAVLLVRGEKQ